MEHSSLAFPLCFINFSTPPDTSFVNNGINQLKLSVLNTIYYPEKKKKKKHKPSLAYYRERNCLTDFLLVFQPHCSSRPRQVGHPVDHGLQMVLYRSGYLPQKSHLDIHTRCVICSVTHAPIMLTAFSTPASHRFNKQRCLSLPKACSTTCRAKISFCNKIVRIVSGSIQKLEWQTLSKKL